MVKNFYKPTNETSIAMFEELKLTLCPVRWPEIPEHVGVPIGSTYKNLVTLESGSPNVYNLLV